MRILLISTKDYLGGASIAAYRLYHLLKQNKDFDVRLIVGEKFKSDPDIVGPEGKFQNVRYLLHRALDYLPLKVLKKNGSLQWYSNRLFIKKINDLNPDIVNIHFVQNGFLSISDLKRIKAKKVICTMHDMWSVLGIEHYSYDENKHLLPTRSSFFDIDYLNQKRKRKIWKNLSMTIHSPSNWMHNIVRESYTLKNHIHIKLPNALDTDLFKPLDKLTCKALFDIPEKNKSVLFGAVSADSDKRKGFATILNLIHEQKYNWLAFGTDKPLKGIHGLGVLIDQQSLVAAYNAADVFVAPSILDNLPNTIVESISCGTPVVAYNVGGIPDIIDHKINGYLANPGDSGDFMRGIEWCLENNQAASKAARAKALKDFSYNALRDHYYSKIFKLP